MHKIVARHVSAAEGTPKRTINPSYPLLIMLTSHWGKNQQKHKDEPCFLEAKYLKMIIFRVRRDAISCNKTQLSPAR